MKKQILLFFTFFIISVQMVAVATAGGEIGISSGKLNFRLAPGEQAEKTISLTNSGNEAVTFDVYIDQASHACWFSLTPSSFDLQPGKCQKVRVRLRVPSSLRADTDCKILFEPSDGSTFAVGIKVPVHIDINGSGGSSSGGSTSGNGGGSGGGGGSPEPQSNVESKELSQQFIGNGNRVRFEFLQETTSVGYVEFGARKSFGKTTTVVEELKGRSFLSPEAPKGEVYRHLNIWVGNGGVAAPENIENALVGFRVSRAWIEDNSIDVDSIILQHFNGEEWAVLPTTKSRESGEYIYFEAETPGFSPFAITGNKLSLSETQVKTPEDIEASISGGQNRSSSSSSNNKGGTGSLPGFGSILGGTIAVVSARFLSKRKSR